MTQINESFRNYEELRKIADDKIAHAKANNENDDWIAAERANASAANAFEDYLRTLPEDIRAETVKEKAMAFLRELASGA